jgi:hypothetical protein
MSTGTTVLVTKSNKSAWKTHTIVFSALTKHALFLVPLGETSINFADYLKVKSSVPEESAQQPEGEQYLYLKKLLKRQGGGFRF